MNHSGQLPHGQYQPTQPQPQQQQQHGGRVQYAAYATAQNPQGHWGTQQQAQYPPPVMGYGGYDGGFSAAEGGFPGGTQARQQQQQLQTNGQAQNWGAYYNAGTANGQYGGGTDLGGGNGMTMPSQMGGQGDYSAWTQQRQPAPVQQQMHQIPQRQMAPMQQQVHQQQRQPTPTQQRPQQQQQQGYHVPSPQMQQQDMNAHAFYGNQNPYQGQGQHARGQSMGAQQMAHLQQPPRRSPSISQQQQQQHIRPSPQAQHQPSPQLQQQMQQRPSPQVQHQPSPQLQQHYAMNSPAQAQQGYQQMQPQGQPQAYHQQIPRQQQTQASPSVPNQQAQQVMPQARQQTQIRPNPEAQSYQGQARPHEMTASAPARNQNQTRAHVPSPNPNQVQQVPSPTPQLQPQAQPSTGTQFAHSTTTLPPGVPYQPAPPIPQEQTAQVLEPQQFVNLQDIQAMPKHKPPVAVPSPNKARSSNAISSQPTSATTPSALQPSANIERNNSTLGTPKLPPGISSSSRIKVEKTPRPSVSQSPQTPSGNLSTSQSPAMQSRKVLTNSNGPLLVAVGEQMIEVARSATVSMVAEPQESQVTEYHRLISTGLACFETALQKKDLSPRQEARLRLRYAAVLQEETENITEAETTLSKGITLCDKHRLPDLKYCMQYLMMKVLYRRNHKAGLKALDQHISDCDTYQHVHWSYAFRLLKASFYEESGNTTDAACFDNMRAIQSVASARGDVAMSVYASLSEALMMLKTSRGTPENIHSCLAQAAKYQFDEEAKLPQLEVLSGLLQVATDLHREGYDALGERLRDLQKKIDSCSKAWRHGSFLMPITQAPSGSQTIGSDTSAIIRPGNAEPKNKDYIVMTFMSQSEIAAIVFSITGLNYLHKQNSPHRNGEGMWQEGLKLLNDVPRMIAASKKPALLPLKQAIDQRKWQVRMKCYLLMLLGLVAASHCKWDEVSDCIYQADEASRDGGLDGSLRSYYCYLKGAYFQGIGDLGRAIEYFQDESLSLLNRPTLSAAQQDLALLAGVNRIWIMQRPDGMYDWPYENHELTRELIDQLEPWCSNHHVGEIRTAWWVVMSTAVQSPPIQRNQRKEFANRALHTSRTSENIFAKLISTLVARDLLYNNVQSDQATKCIQAAGTWSQKSRNPLWQSVAAGIIAETCEAKNEREQAEKFFEQGTKAAQAAFRRNG